MTEDLLMPREKFTQVVERIDAGDSQVKIARELGITPRTVRKIIRGEHFYQVDAEERLRRIKGNRPPAEAREKQHRYLSEQLVISREKFEQVVDRIDAGERQVKIARELHVADATVRKIIRGEHFYQVDAEEQLRRLQGRRLSAGARKKKKPDYLPKPAQIAAACAELRARRVAAGA